MLAEIGRTLDAVLFFDIPDEVALGGSPAAPRRRAVTTTAPRRIARRLAIYHEHTEPVVERYRATGKLVPAPRRALHRRGRRRDRRRRSSCSAKGRRRDHPQEPRRDRPHRRRRGDRRGDDRARRRADRARASRPSSSTGSRRTSSAAKGGIPTSQGYRGYPRAICISVNEVVVHGIPDDRVVEDGDLVTIDVGVTLDGAIADSAYTFGSGRSTPAEAQRLLDVAQDALAAGIAEARLGNRIGDISHAVQTVVEGAGFSVVRSLVGHGVGRHYHEDPHVPNFGRARPRAAALGGDDDRDRADDHGREPRGVARRGRLDDLDRGRLPVRAFRAHRGDPPRWAAHPHPARRASPRSAAPPSAARRSDRCAVVGVQGLCYTARPARRPVGCARTSA